MSDTENDTQNDGQSESPAAPAAGANEPDVHPDDGKGTPPHGDDKPPSPSSGA